MRDRLDLQRRDWFGLPGPFMAGIVAGALLAAVAYVQHVRVDSAMSGHREAAAPAAGSVPADHPALIMNSADF